jgi:hypothetical protein
MMELHRGMATILQIMMINVLVMSIPLASIAAEIWPDHRAIASEGLTALGSSECKLITHDCEVCITQVGSGMVNCSKRSANCIPTVWTCFEGLGDIIEGTKQRLVFAQSYANRPERTGVASSKIFHDRVPSSGILETQMSVRGDFGKPAIQLPTELPSFKLYHERLKTGN